MTFKTENVLFVLTVALLLLGALMLGRDFADVHLGGYQFGPPDTTPLWRQLPAFLLESAVHYWPLTVAFALTLIGILRGPAPKWMLTAMATLVVCLLAPIAFAQAPPPSAPGNDAWLRPAVYSLTCPALGGVELRAFYTLHGRRVPLWVGNHWPERWRTTDYDAAGHDRWSPVANVAWLKCGDTRFTAK